MIAIAQSLQGSPSASAVKTLIHRNVELSEYTSLKIGGPAEYFASPNSFEDLTRVMAFAKVLDLPWFILGNGTNMLVPDEGFRGLVIHLGRNFGAIRIEENRLQAQAGAGLGETMGYLRHQGFHDFDGLIGIPGTVGGAITMNAGIPEFAISDRVLSVTALTGDGALIKLDYEDCEFGYRSSRFQNSGWIIVSAEFELGMDERFDLKDLMDRRRDRQPLRWPSPGCVFKNPPGTPGAGWLIEQAGLKGMIYGGAMISSVHGNFIVNRGSATAADVQGLIDFAREKVYKEFGVELQLEVAVVSNLR